jgi:hypothetical protein
MKLQRKKEREDLRRKHIEEKQRYFTRPLQKEDEIQLLQKVILNIDGAIKLNK